VTRPQAFGGEISTTKSPRGISSYSRQNPSIRKADGNQNGGRPKALARPLTPVAAPDAVTPAQPQSNPPSASPEPLTKGWQVIGTDQSRKRVAAVCPNCSLAREFGVDAFRSGAVRACDCTERAVGPVQRLTSFAVEIMPNRHRGTR